MSFSVDRALKFDLGFFRAERLASGVRSAHVRGVVSHTAGGLGACDDPRVPITVLIVDDHPGFRAMARAMLADGGYTVVGEAADAHAAVAVAQLVRPDLVLVDVQLGDADGFAVAQTLAGDVAGPVVVLTSGRDRRDLEPLIRDSAARGFIAKEKLSPAALGEFLR
jgi:CheY-like chemotaxis protein